MKTLAILAVLALSAINLTAQNSVVVHGTVYFNGQPVPNVSVYLFQANPFPGCLNCGGPRDIDGFLRCYAGNQDVQCLRDLGGAAAVAITDEKGQYTFGLGDARAWLDYTDTLVVCSPAQGFGTTITKLESPAKSITINASINLYPYKTLER